MGETDLDCEMINKLLPIRMTSTVVRGFGRGSTDLGIPTANLDREKTALTRVSDSEDKSVPVFEELPCGIYWGFCRVGETAVNETKLVYKTALSIGYNPTYGNEKKTVEPHLIAPHDDNRRHASSCGETVLGDMYGQSIRLSVVGYIRPELPFEGLDKLIEAIKKDILKAEELGDSQDTLVLKEREWVLSENELITTG